MKRILPLLLLLLLSVAANAEIEKTLTFQSPDKRWSVVAQWTDVNRGGYLWELRDSKTGKVYFKEEEGKITSNEALPYRFVAEWTKDGHYVAVYDYYGRITYDTLVIDVRPSEPREVTLFPKDLKDYNGFSTSGQWLNNTDLKVEAFDVGRKLGRRRRDLVIRFTTKGSRIITRSEWYD
jgi:hypothetical protein